MRRSKTCGSTVICSPPRLNSRRAVSSTWSPNRNRKSGPPAGSSGELGVVQAVCSNNHAALQGKSSSPASAQPSQTISSAIVQPQRSLTHEWEDRMHSRRQSELIGGTTLLAGVPRRRLLQGAGALGLAAILRPAAVFAEPDDDDNERLGPFGPWSTPVNLGPVVNTRYSE